MEEHRVKKMEYNEMEEHWITNKDILIDILSRLPSKTLFGLKCISKEWHSLLSEPSFIKLHLKMKEPISGFFFQERFQWCDIDIKSISYIPIDAKGSEVYRTVFNFLPENVVLLAVCNGMICCRSSFPSSQPVLYICNPMRKEWVTIQWPEPDKRSSLGLAFDPFKDWVDKSTNFNVVQVHETVTYMEDEDDYSSTMFSFDIYSSKTQAWLRSTETCECRHSLCKSKGIYVKGAMFWLTNGDQILMFDFENELALLVKVPLPLMEFNSIPEICFGESEGKLHYVLISEEGIQIWVLEDYFESTWALKYSIDLDELEREYSHFLCNIRQRIARRLTVDRSPEIGPLAYKDGILFMRVAVKIYLFKFDTRKIEELCDLSVLGPHSLFAPIVLPYAMSLVTLP